MEKPAEVPTSELRPMHPLAVRVMHWINAVAMIILILSGWQIYNDEVLFGWLHFPPWMTLGDGAEGGLQWHFFAMWILFFNTIAYAIYGFSVGRFQRMLFPITLAGVIEEMRRALQLKLRHDDLTQYNPVQRLLYLGVMIVIVIQILSGLVIWKPVQFSEIAWIFGDFQGARLAHFLGMAAICGFLLVHVALALIVPETLVAMFKGGPLVRHDVPSPAADKPDAPRTTNTAV
jgi:thiosulfate reductase cytochrome b subunit